MIVRKTLALKKEKTDYLLQCVKEEQKKSFNALVDEILDGYIAQKQQQQAYQRLAEQYKKYPYQQNQEDREFCKDMQEVALADLQRLNPY